MPADAPSEDLMHYDLMAQEAMRGVVRTALQRAALPEGLPGDHHFYITFRTKAPGVSGPPEILTKYPDEMTIVLQHQYEDLQPGETGFAVTLRFGGAPKRLSMPYAAVLRFYDPSVQFMLQFEAVEDAAPAAEAPVEPPSPEPPDDAPKVVSLDQFRKK